MEGLPGRYCQSVYAVFEAYRAAGWPELCTDMVDAVMKIPFEKLLGMFGELHITEEETDSKSSEYFSEALCNLGSPGLTKFFEIEFHIDGLDLSFVSSEEEAKKGFDPHGVMVVNRTIGWRNRLTAEAVMLGCVRSVLRTNRENPNLGVVFDTLAAAGNWQVEVPTEDTVISSNGLRAHRMDGFRNAMLCIGVMEGKYVPKPENAMLTADKRRKPSLTRKLEANSPLNDYFAKVEFDASITKEVAKEIAACYIDMVSSRAIHVFGRSSGVILRFRRFPNDNRREYYTSGLKNIVVNSRDLGTFIHEYGHAIDFGFGVLSKDEKFDRMYDLYKAEVEYAVGTNRKYNLDYFFRRTEVFARCYEIYISRIYGTCVLLNDFSDDKTYPDTEEFVFEVMNYFNELDRTVFRHHD